MKHLRRLLCSAALISATAGAHAATLYSNDFSDSSLGMSNWSSSAGLNFSTPPANTAGINQFLGEYGGTQSVRFALTDESLRNATVTLTLDFLAIRSWDGQDPTWGGPDRFTILLNGATLLDKNFSNGAGRQTYTLDELAPNGLPFAAGANDFPMAGSSAQYALGYSFWDGINVGTYDPQDAIYRMVFTVSLSDVNELSLVFAGAGLQDTWIENDPRCSELAPQFCRYRDESWGLDNFLLTLDSSIRIPGPAIPLPGTLVILSAGMIGFLGVTRTRAKR